MKKIYMLVMLLVVGISGLMAQNVTDEKPQAYPESGPLSQEEMEEVISYMGGPEINWGSEALYANPDSEETYADEDMIYVDVYVNEEPFWQSQTYGFLYPVDYNEPRGMTYLDIELGGIWYYILMDIVDGYLDPDFELSLVIKQGALFVGKEGGDVNGEVKLTYQFENVGPSIPELPPVPAGVYVDPENESEIAFDSIASNPIQIIWGNGSPLYFNMDMDSDAGYYDEYDESFWVNLLINGSLYDYIPMRIVSQEEDGQIVYSYLEVDVTGGWSWEDIEDYYGQSFTMQILIPEGALYVGSPNGEPNEEFGLTYSVVEGEPEPSYLPAPQTVLSDNNILYFYWNQEIKLADGSASGYLFTSNQGAEPVTFKLASYNNGNNNAVSLDLNPYIEKYSTATYTVNLPEGQITNVDGTAENETAKWVGDITSTGINVISAANVNAPVYNLQGVKVADSVNGLSNGIYIVNGKKVVIRK